MYFETAPIPPARELVFTHGIDHPDLWLWDSWTMQEPDAELNLYCLALSKTRPDGAPILPAERNDFTFHVRRFISLDAGGSWRDRGPVMQPGQVADGADGRNIWSGSTLRLDKETVAFGFTGVRDCGTRRRFLQTICVAIGTGAGRPGRMPETALSCPLRDYETIVSKGYYLGPRDTLGNNEGEDGGPIMAWRDPFLFSGPDGQLHAVWSAKLSPTIPAIAHARLERTGDRIGLVQLSAPIELPDAHLMTQAEVPKIYRDPASGDFLMMISACDRRYEGQSDRELTHVHRLYRSSDLNGPWAAYGHGGSSLPGLEGLFGASLVAHDVATGRFSVLGPHTENAGPKKQLTFADVVEVEVEVEVEAGLLTEQPGLA